MNKYDRLISSIVVTDMDFDQLDSFLQLQMKKKDVRYMGTVIVHVLMCVESVSFVSTTLDSVV